jgi:uncharacterized membrane protein YdjX (TVP38/TMEM64 family)
LGSDADKPRSFAWLRAALLIAIIVGAFLAIRYTSLGEWTDEARIRAALVDIRGLWWTPILLLVLYAVIAPTGMSMFPLTIAGAAFGPLAGAVLNTIGIVIGAATTFATGRALGRDFVVRLTGDRFRKAERILNRQGIWPLIQIRFMPVPYPVVNFAAALSDIPARRFMLASIVGLIPATLIHSYFIARLIYASGPERVVVAFWYAFVLIATNALIGIAWFHRGRQRRARLLALKAQRAARQAVIGRSQGIG